MSPAAIATGASQSRDVVRGVRDLGVEPLAMVDSSATVPERARQLLLTAQAGDAVACAIPLPALDAELDRLGCPPALKRAIPLIKTASVAGLAAGRRWPRVGRLTTDALAAYFVCALGAHARVRDPLWRWTAAAGMLGLTLTARRSFVVEEPESEPRDATIDLRDKSADDAATPARTAPSQPSV